MISMLREVIAIGEHRIFVDEKDGLLIGAMLSFEPHDDVEGEPVLLDSAKGIRSANVIFALLTGKEDALNSIKFDYSVLGKLTQFEQRVILVLSETQAGERLSYGQMATKAGYPRAARAVGNALSKNPFPIVLPCHRVIRASGEIGSFGSGMTHWKGYLLDIEKKYFSVSK